MSASSSAFALSATLALILLSSCSAFARDDHDDHRRGYNKHHGTHYPVHHTPRTDNRKYYGHAQHYFPGNGYGVREHMGYYHPVPVHVLTRLGPAPYGHFYSMRGRDVLVVSQRDHLIAQIISFFGY